MYGEVWNIMIYNSDVPDPNKHEQAPDIVRERSWCLSDSCQHIVDWRERHRHSHARTHADTHPYTCMYTETWHSRTHTHMQTHARTRKYTHSHADSHTYTRTQTRANKRARTHTPAHRHSHDTHAHTHMHADTHVTRAQGRTLHACVSLRVEIGFWFLVCYATTQLATQLQQRCIQVVRSNKEARNHLTGSNSTPAMDFGCEEIRKRKYTQRRIEQNTQPQ